MTRAHRIVAKLLAAYPEPGLELQYGNPLELLMAVILSAQCTDARVNQVTRDLFRKYKTARDYARAQPATLEQEIRSTGFYRDKAKRLIACGKALAAQFGGEVPHTLEELTSLPGVGRKTANMVLGNAFGVPGISVDTHVLRVASRLGLADSADTEKVEQALMQQVPKPQWTAFSNALILHGRRVCKARAPKCGDCPMSGICPWPEKTS